MCVCACEQLYAFCGKIKYTQTSVYTPISILDYKIFCAFQCVLVAFKKLPYRNVLRFWVYVKLVTFIRMMINIVTCTYD